MRAAASPPISLDYRFDETWKKSMEISFTFRTISVVLEALDHTRSFGALIIQISTRSLGTCASGRITCAGVTTSPKLSLFVGTFHTRAKRTSVMVVPLSLKSFVLLHLLRPVSARNVGSPRTLVEELRHAAGAHRDVDVWLQHHRRGSLRGKVLLVQVLPPTCATECALVRREGRARPP